MPFQNNAWFRNWRDAGINWRMEIIGVSLGVDVEDVFLPVVWNELPDEVIILFNGGPRRQYDKLPHAAPETGDCSGVADLGSMRWAPEAEELRQAFTTHVSGTWHAFDLGEPVTPGESRYENYETSTVIRFLWDKGLNGNPTQVYFQGAITSRPPRAYPIQNGTIQVNFTVVDLHRLALQTVKTSYLARWMKNNVTPRGPHGIEYGFMFKHGDHVYTRAYCGPDGAPRYSWYWKLYDLYRGMRLLAMDAYRGYLRQVSAALSFEGTPFSTLQIFKWLYTNTLERGDPLAWDSLYFRGAVADSTGGGFISANEGLLIDNGKPEQQSLHNTKFKNNCYDLAKSWWASTLVKVQWVYVSADDARAVCMHPKVSRISDLTVQVDDALREQKPVPQQPGRAVRAVKWGVPGLAGRDLATCEVPSPLPGIRSEEVMPLAIMFHNALPIGDDGTAYGRGRVIDIAKNWEFQPLPDIPGEHIAVCTHPPYSMWNLFYFEQANDGTNDLTTGEVPFLVHPEVEVGTGGSTVAYPATFPEWPVYSGTESSNDPMVNGWGETVLRRLETLQATTCIPFAVAKHAGLWFGTAEQTLWENIEVDMVAIGPDRLGDKLIIGDGTGNSFLPPGETYGAFLRAYGIIVSYEGNMENGRARIDILGV
jgi:hypothetical protein